MSILQPYPHYKHLQSQKVNTTRFCSEKAHTTNFCDKKAHTTNLCSDKKRTLQTFVIKKRTLQTFVMTKSGHYKLCIDKKWTWPRQTDVNKNLQSAHLGYFLAYPALLCIQFLKLKME